MKTKLLIVVVTMLFAPAMMAQTSTQVAPAGRATGDMASACACCSGDRCPMGKGGKMPDGNSCCNHGCCKDGQRDVAAHKNAKGCWGDKCPMIKGAKSASVSCCTEGATSCHAAAACCGNGKVRPTRAFGKGDCYKPA